MKKIISCTGTFSIGRKAFETMLSMAGHEVVSLSGKTQILLVGEKTSSDSKIKRAHDSGVWVFEEKNAARILEVLGRCDEAGYIPARRRGWGEGGVPERFTARPNQAGSVFFDYMSTMQDWGEWDPDEDGKNDYHALIGENPKGRENLENFFSHDLGIDIFEEEKETFFKNFFRALCLAIFPSEVEMLLEDEEDGFFPNIECEWSELKIDSADFWEKFCYNFEFEDSEERQEFSKQKAVKELIFRYKEDEARVN